jgi:hypothetical protein
MVSISAKTVGAAGNDAKFLTSFRSSTHIPNNFWSWTISSQAKEGREDKDKLEVGAKMNQIIKNRHYQKVTN